MLKTMFNVLIKGRAPEGGMDSIPGMVLPDIAEIPTTVKAALDAPHQKSVMSEGKTPMSVLKLGSKIRLGAIMKDNIHWLRRSTQRLLHQPMQTQADTAMISELKTKIKDLGALSVGYTKLTPLNVFHSRSVLYENAIVFTCEMDASDIAKAPSEDTLFMIQRTYADTGRIACRLTDWLREKGHGAQAGPGLGGLSVYPELARQAGLGELGRHGLLITPECGPRIRLGVVYTSITNLPIVSENPHSWIRDFCATCGHCARACPGSAIREVPKDRPGGKTCIEYERCLLQFSNNYGCTVCVRECIFTKRQYQNIKNFFK